MGAAAPIPSGFECASCAAPRVSPAASAQGDPPAEPERSDGPKLALASLLALLMVAVLVYGGISGSASMGREKAEAARKAAAREARYAKEEADRKAAAERVASAAQAQSDAQADAALQERKRKDAQDLADLKAEADAGLNVAPPSAPSPASSAPPAATTVPCALCHGAGTLAETCDECDGTGQVVCDTCTTLARYTPKSGWGSFGERRDRCPKYGGTSVPVRDVSGHDTYYYTCPTCHGTKRATKTCPCCHGTGNAPS